jgi:PAS domain S-box-containing protein
MAQMFSAPIPDNDAERLATLHSYAVLDTAPEQGYEDVTAFATYICEVPYSTITFVDKERQWFKSEFGFGIRETGRGDGFCACALLQPETMIVEDTLLDPRFMENPFVLDGPKIRFYAGAPIVAPNGHILGTVCVFDDKPRKLSAAQIASLESLARQVQMLLEQRSAIARLETALAVSKASELRLGELAAIVDSTDDAILSKNLDGIITSWNMGASRIFGYSAEEMIGQSILKLIPVEFHSDETLIIGKVRAGERVEHFETVRLTKDGQRLDVSLTVSPVKNESGKVIGASKILRDISGRKKIEMALLQSEKIAATGRMAATIAHEVNNPLEAVTNLLYLLRPIIADAAGLEYLAMAESEIARVSHIAKQTLGFYKEHSSAKSTQISELLEQAMKVYEPRCAANGITVEKSLSPVRKLVLRRGEMLQVVSNLIANSMYAMRSGGVLSVSVKDTDEGIGVEVKDTGVGVAATDIPRVFDAFFTTRGSIGTGIGLFVARQFIEGHGGRIELTSTQDEKDHGTVVRIYLPHQTTYDVEEMGVA